MQFNKLYNCYDSRHPQYVEDGEPYPNNQQIADELTKDFTAAKLVVEAMLDDEGQLNNEYAGNSGPASYDQWTMAQAVVHALQAAQAAKKLGDAGLDIRKSCAGVIKILLLSLPCAPTDNYGEQLDHSL